jgi:Ca2+-transporting ATPase
LQVAEASLTGESQPVAKEIAPVAEDAVLGDRTNMVLGGTVATFGRGRAVVVQTGMDTEMGHIAGMIQRAPVQTTPLQLEIDRVGRLLGVAVVVIAAIVIGTILLTSDVTGTDVLVEVMLLGVSLAVAAVPEGLATVLTVVLALGVQRMAGRNAIVKKLAAVETLGSATVVCTDKTGNSNQERDDRANDCERKRNGRAHRCRLRSQRRRLAGRKADRRWRPAP